MAKQSRRSRPSLIETLERRPGGFDLFQAIRIAERAVALEREAGGRLVPEPVGYGTDPARAAVRMTAGTSLSFATAEVTQASFEPGGAARLVQTVIGLTGAGGAMPHAFSEMVQVSLRDRNTGLRDFLDLFNDRFAALFYEAFAKYKLVLETERRPLTGLSPIERVVRATIGIGVRPTGRAPAIPDSVLLHHAGLLGRHSRSAHAVEAALSNAFGQSVRMEQFVGEWLRIEAEEQTRLGEPARGMGRFCGIGRDAIVGRRSWSVHGRIRLRIGPLDREAFESFLPGGWRHARLAAFAAFALGPDVSCVRRLVLKPEAVPRWRLGARRLGWNTWARSDAARRDPGVVDLAPIAALHL